MSAAIPVKILFVVSVSVNNRLSPESIAGDPVDSTDPLVIASADRPAMC